MSDSTLFICNMSNVGGVETLMLRIAKELKHKFAILTLAPILQEFIDELQVQKVTFFEYKEYRGLCRFLLLKENLGALVDQINDKLSSIQLIYAFNLHTFIVGLVLQKMFFKDAKLVLGIYHPNEISWFKHKYNLESIIVRYIFRKTPSENVLFMNEQCRNSHLAIDPAKITSRIFPVYIDLARFELVKRVPKKCKIVSIGRLVSFKYYIITLLDSIEELIKNGISVEYHVYGYGELENELNLKIKQKKLDKYVFFHGKLDYNQLDKIFEDVYIFVGMGTSVIEASAAGVPSLLAIVNNYAPVTYGWFHDIEGFASGEHMENEKLFSYTQLIRHLSQDSDLYDSYSALSRQKASKFDIKCLNSKFHEIKERAKLFKFPNLDILIYGYILARLINSLIDKMFKRNFYSNRY